MPKTFTVQVATPERVCFEREIVSFVAPAADGYLGVMANHAPMVAELEVGEIRMKDAAGEEELLAITGGFLSVSDNLAVILADAAEAAIDIDIDRARKAEERARERLHAQRAAQAEGLDDERARFALIRAINRLTVARKGR